VHASGADRQKQTTVHRIPVNATCVNLQFLPYNSTKCCRSKKKAHRPLYDHELKGRSALIGHASRYGFLPLMCASSLLTKGCHGRLFCGITYLQKHRPCPVLSPGFSNHIFQLLYACNPVIFQAFIYTSALSQCLQSFYHPDHLTSTQEI
jgi:hypothetical protein